MTYNLIDASRNLFNPETTEKAAAYLGEPLANVAKAVNAVLPTILAEVTNKTATADGAASIMKLLQEQQKAGIVEDISVYFDVHRSGILNKGASAFYALFGTKADKAIVYIAGYSGLRTHAVNLLMSIAVPGILSTIARYTTEVHLNRESIHFILDTQRNKIQSTIPAGFNLDELVGGNWQLTVTGSETSEDPEPTIIRIMKKLVMKRNQALFLVLLILAIICALVAIWYLFNHDFEAGDPRHIGNVKAIVQSQLPLA